MEESKDVNMVASAKHNSGKAMMVAVCSSLTDRNPASATPISLPPAQSHPALPVFESQYKGLAVHDFYRTGQISRQMPLCTLTLADVTTFCSVYPRTRIR